MNFDPLRRYTQARIGLGNAFPALPTSAWLQFAYHHALAMDAIQIPWQRHNHHDAISACGLQMSELATRVSTREEYLLRPDRGRLLSEESKKQLLSIEKNRGDVVIVASNGLSSTAVKNHLDPLLTSLLAAMRLEQLSVATNQIFLVDNARVGLIDDIGDALSCPMGVMIIGERPGLSSPDSLAIYVTYKPQRGRTDADRNCISNIRPPHGMAYEHAAQKTVYLIKESLRRKLSGVLLKDETHLLNHRTE